MPNQYIYNQKNGPTSSKESGPSCLFKNYLSLKTYGRISPVPPQSGQSGSYRPTYLETVPLPLQCVHIIALSCPVSLCSGSQFLHIQRLHIRHHPTFPWHLAQTIIVLVFNTIFPRSVNLMNNYDNEETRPFFIISMALSAPFLVFQTYLPFFGQDI